MIYTKCTSPTEGAIMNSHNICLLTEIYNFITDP